MTTEQNNLIPTVAVTDALTPEQAFAEGRSSVEALLDRGDSYLMLGISNSETAGIDIICACTDDQIPDMVMTAVQMLGMSCLGPDKLAVLPGQMAAAISLQVGFQRLNDLIQLRNEMALARAANGDVSATPAE